ncbi:hypothetical protein PoB_006931400 [Plakobranchus ocellatus]|uniref:Tyrosine specific protein phosphatases domain-containing protein n=1 Tax=Plakobranchus ocellatus TaxID=259542 RepID=A0AAV4DFC7_9GAST|nr:hypothetical protein PoB_006931400 [Plakobranchus ocellatus]
MKHSSIAKRLGFLGLPLLTICLLSQTPHINASARRRGDLEFSETDNYPEETEQLPKPLRQEQQDQPHDCDNSTIGGSSSCPHHLLTTLYGDTIYDNPLFSKRKMWFARRLNIGIHVAGQLTARQIKYAADSGFKSIVTIFDQDGKKGPNGDTLILSTLEEEELANLAGMKFFRVLKREDDWFSVTAVERMSAVYPKVELPALFHCERGVSVALLILLHYARETRKTSRSIGGQTPFMDSKRFYELNNLHGIDFVDVFSSWTNETIENITGTSMPADVSKPIVALSMWCDYWQAHPIRGNWFIAGQINEVDLPTINSTGFHTVLNLRDGLTHDTKPSQENVELVNIQSGTSTYDINANPLRQASDTLKKLVIDVSKPSEFISPTSLTNYEAENAEEFGDHIGYNENMEQRAVKAAGIEYVHLPLREQGRTLEEDLKLEPATEISLENAGRLSQPLSTFKSSGRHFPIAQDISCNHMLGVLCGCANQLFHSISRAAFVGICMDETDVFTDYGVEWQ